MTRVSVRSRIALAALALATCGGAPRALRAESSETLAAVSRLDALLAQLTAPAPAEVVRDLLALPEAGDAEPALRIAGALWHAGGPHAAEALRELVRHDDAGVREAALRGIAVLGLRGKPGSRAEANLRRLLDDAVPGVRRAAYDALARIGTPDDVADLIERLGADEPDVRSLALRTLRDLTAERLTPDPGRWAYWWERARPSLEAQVGAAIATLDADPDELEAAAAWSVLERRAWAVPDLAEQTARRWLGAWEAEQRRDGYRLCAALRALSLVKPVAAAVRRDRTGPAAEAALATQRTLGLVASPSR